MIGKRFLLIAGGTVGGLGAVLSITPPQFGSSGGLVIPSGTSNAAAVTTTPLTSPTPATSSAPTQATTTPTPVATKTIKKRTTKKKKKKVPTTTKTTTPALVATPTPKPTPKPTPSPSPAGVSGTFTGVPGNTRYGPVQVQITVVNNKITNAVALVYPTESFRDQQINQQAIPYLIQETLSAQSANIQGVGGASYTSQGWVDSLQSALTKAGL